MARIIGVVNANTSLRKGRRRLEELRRNLAAHQQLQHACLLLHKHAQGTGDKSRSLHDIQRPAPCTTHPAPQLVPYTPYTTAYALYTLHHSLCFTHPTPQLMPLTPCTTHSASHIPHHSLRPTHPAPQLMLYTPCTTAYALYTLHHKPRTTLPAPQLVPYIPCTPQLVPYIPSAHHSPLPTPRSLQRHASPHHTPGGCRSSRRFRSTHSALSHPLRCPLT